MHISCVAIEFARMAISEINNNIYAAFSLRFGEAFCKARFSGFRFRPDPLEYMIERVCRRAITMATGGLNAPLQALGQHSGLSLK